MKGSVLTVTQIAPRLEDDDEQLLAEAYRNPAAFESLYERYLPRVFSYLLARVENRAEAEDLTAQVFLAAYEGLARYRHRGQFAAWLFGIARNKAADHHRAGETRRLTALDESIAASHDPLAGVIADETRCRLAKLLAQLDDDERELLRLRFAAELNFDNIAQVLARKPSTVKMAVYRLLERLQQLMETEE